MTKYNHLKIEKKWQKYWETKKIFVAKDTDKRPKKYILDMFPYPSGAGLHVGHPEGYTATDILSRYSRMKGFNVMHPMGWDAFGLPAENYAIKEGIHPQKTTQKNIKRFTEQIKSIGLSYDWSREVSTSAPDYYKWTQWLFLQLYKKGLAYKKEANVNWCPKDNTVLANEQVVDGACERCGTKVVQKNLSQWFFKITNYAEELLADLDKLDWPEPIKSMQRNWIGKSQGAEINFELAEKSNYVLLHGFHGSPDGIFFPWLKKQLDTRGLQYQAPQLPNTDNPTEEEQVSFVLKNCKFDENTILLGHSLGCVVAMKVLEKLDKKIGGLVLAGGFSSPEFKDKPRPFHNTFDWQFDYKKIKSSAGFVEILSDPNDYAVRIEQGRNLHKNLGGNFFEVAGTQPHFTASQEPAILESLVPKIKVFTTRPDTIFGATYMVLAPEHPLVQNLKSAIKNWEEVEKYLEQAKGKTDLQRSALEKEKTGVELKGIKAINPATGEQIPIWIADYVLMGYGTGAIMAVPAHDERDRQFAEKYRLPIVDKPLVPIEEAIKKYGNAVTKYKLRDWLVSRQRYWGAPIPIIYCKTCGQQAVPEKDLPVKLPTDTDFRPTGESPLKRSKKFSKVICPNCKEPAERDYDTMDTFVDSSWYFLRYIDPKNKSKFASPDKIKKWMPVDTYVGGAEHAVLHLLYSRFFTKALRDLGYLNFGEPFIKLKNQGLILGPDGEKMSKSRGNVINPDDVIKEHGADSLRMYEMFMGPLEDAKPWQTNGIVGVRRFLDRVWNWVNEKYTVSSKQNTESDNVQRALHKLIKKITEDIQNFSFNTSISAFMEFYNQVKDEPTSKTSLKTFLILLYPFAPHISEELNQVLQPVGKNRGRGLSVLSLQLEKWPSYNAKLIIDETVEIVVQVNGKVKGKLTVANNSDQVTVSGEAKKLVGIDQVKREVFVPNRLINFVV